MTSNKDIEEHNEGELLRAFRELTERVSTLEQAVELQILQNTLLRSISDINQHRINGLWEYLGVAPLGVDHEGAE